MSSAIHKRHSIEELRAIVAPVAEKYGVDKVYLFGSVARGDYNENSDYDFCIENLSSPVMVRVSGYGVILKPDAGAK